MAGKGIHTYTAAEGTNIALGQGGSMLITVADEENTPPKGTVFTAFTVIGTSDVTFNTLTQEDTSLYFGTGGSELHTGPPGEILTNSLTGASFPSGITIYGRWTAINIDSGAIVAYLGS
tara:strand:+ start:1988 stop:2344 length:357 start_codon:yes stop_codon:yes gene_type:complete